MAVCFEFKNLIRAIPVVWIALRSLKLQSCYTICHTVNCPTIFKNAAFVFPFAFIWKSVAFSNYFWILLLFLSRSSLYSRNRKIHAIYLLQKLLTTLKFSQGRQNFAIFFSNFVLVKFPNLLFISMRQGNETR